MPAESFQRRAPSCVKGHLFNRGAYCYILLFPRGIRLGRFSFSALGSCSVIYGNSPRLMQVLELLEKCLNLKCHFKGIKILENENVSMKIDHTP